MNYVVLADNLRKLAEDLRKEGGAGVGPAMAAARMLAHWLEIREGDRRLNQARAENQSNR